MLKKRGFTLVELIAVITILSLLMIILIPNVSKVSDSSKLTIRDSKINTIVSAGEEYGNNFINHYKDCLGTKDENTLSNNCTVDINYLIKNEYLESEDEDGHIIDPDTKKPFLGNVLLCYNPIDIDIYGYYVEDNHYSCMDIDTQNGNTLYIKSSINGYVGGDPIDLNIVTNGNFSKFTCESTNNLASCEIINSNKTLRIAPTKNKNLLSSSTGEDIITLKGYYNDGLVLSKTTYLTLYKTNLELQSENNKCMKINSTESINITNTNGGHLLSTSSHDDIISSDIRGGILYLSSYSKVGNTKIKVIESNGYHSLELDKKVYDLHIINLPDIINVGSAKKAGIFFEGTGRVTITSDDPEIVCFSESCNKQITLTEEGINEFEILSKKIGTTTIRIKGEECGSIENIKFTGSNLNLSSTSGKVYVGGNSIDIDINIDTPQTLECSSSDKESATCLINNSTLTIIPGSKAKNNVTIKVKSSLSGEVSYNLNVIDTNFELKDKSGNKLENFCKLYDEIDDNIDKVYLHGNDLGHVSLDKIDDEKIVNLNINESGKEKTLNLKPRNLSSNEILNSYKTGYNLGRTKITVKEDHGNRTSSFFYNIYKMDIEDLSNSSIFVGDYIDYNIRGSATGNIIAESSNTDIAIVEVINTTSYDDTPNSYNSSIVRVRGIKEGKANITIKGSYCGEKTYDIDVSSREFCIDLEPGTYTTSLGANSLCCTATDPSEGCNVILPDIFTTEEFKVSGYSIIRDNVKSEFDVGNSININTKTNKTVYYGNSIDESAPVCTFKNYRDDFIINKSGSIVLECTDAESGLIDNGEINTNDFKFSNPDIGSIISINKNTIPNGYSYTLNILTKKVGYFNITLNGGVVRDHFENSNTSLISENIISTEYKAVASWNIGKSSRNDIIALLYKNEDIFGDTLEMKNTYSLNIYGTGEMLDFWSDAYHYYPPWYDEYRSNITYLNVAENITNIGSYLMYNAYNLKKINLPEGIKYIGKLAFGNADILSVDLPNSLITIEDQAFYSNNNLTEVFLKDNIKKIGNQAFFHHNLSSLTIPNSVTTIGTAAFMSDSDTGKLSNLVLGNSIKTINEEAFANHKITSLDIPSSIEYLGDKAFMQQSFFSETDVLTNIHFNDDSHLVHIGNQTFMNAKFSNLKLPDKIEYIGNQALSSLKNGITSFTIGKNVNHLGDNFIFGKDLTEFVIDENNVNYKVIDGIIYTSDMTTLIKCPDAYYKISNELNIPESVKILAPGSFAGTQNNDRNIDGLSINIPSNIENLNLEENFNYFSISKINLSNEEYESENGILFSKDKKRILKIPSLIDKEEYNIPLGVETIGDYCAYANSRIKTITIPESVNIIENYAFTGDPDYGISQININSTNTPFYYITSFSIMTYNGDDISSRSRVINVKNERLYNSLISDYQGADYTIQVRRLTDE